MLHCIIRCSRINIVTTETQSRSPTLKMHYKNKKTLVYTTVYSGDSSTVIVGSKQLKINKWRDQSDLPTYTLLDILHNLAYVKFFLGRDCQNGQSKRKDRGSGSTLVYF